MLAFLLLLIGLVLFNRENIGKTLKNTRFIERVMKKDGPPPEPISKKQPETPPDTAPSKTPQPKQPAADLPALQTTKPPAEQPLPTEPKATKNETVKPPAVNPPTQKPEEGTTIARERTLWFVRVENDGVIARVMVKRKMAVSDTPLVDALNALMTGPNSDEKRKGYSSLIPAGTKLLSATVRGSTAYLSFNDQFQFNSYGIEGYATQLRQIVWTATEFGSVKDVQFLIEGRRVDYLGAEGIFIGSPLGRDSL